MKKRFNTTGLCYPEEHYMVNMEESLEEAKELVDRGEYFVINRARQYGKTTMLHMLAEKLSGQYAVFLVSFEGMEDETYETADAFCKRFSRLLSRYLSYNEVTGISRSFRDELNSRRSGMMDLEDLSDLISELCVQSQKPVVLMIDEVDQAGARKIFLDFLGLLRRKYLTRKSEPAFWSVILAGVYDIKNLKLKIRTEDDHKTNSPWNIAADFDVDMSLPESGIAGMLEEYEKDHRTGMEIRELASLLYEYTSGYPFLVSRLCKLMDEKVGGSLEFPDKKDVWTKEGFQAAVRSLLAEENTLFESLDNKLIDFPKLKEMLKDLLLRGKMIEYVPGDAALRTAMMSGFITIVNGTAEVSNRIFEMRLYNGFLAEESRGMEISQAAQNVKNQFITGGHLDMDLVIQKFAMHYTEFFGDCNEKFLEDNGRCVFLLYIKPIINGTGNYYIEARTRTNRRTDVIIDYRGRQYIVELKIWRGAGYDERGREQLADYLDAYHLKRGYLISFNFNKKKQVGVKKVILGDKVLIEAVI